jgi:glycosyltransferase involved in cell wall biosynthesis
MKNGSRICVVPKLTGIGGMVSFQEKLRQGLASRNIGICFDLMDHPYDAVLVIGGSRHIHRLWQVKRKGIRIVQRLDGMNWIHRAAKTGWRHWLRAEFSNLVLSLIRSKFTDKVVYQSAFSRQWWESVRGETRCPNVVIYNGVDLAQFSPGEKKTRPQDMVRLLLVEGSLLGGYEFGMENAVKLVAQIAHSHQYEWPLELMVVGKVSSATQVQWEDWIAERVANRVVHIKWAGVVPHSLIPDIDRSAHLLFSADLNAACPNSVIEAMACGTPVVSFDTGAIKELIQDDGGVVIPYGGDPWSLDSPDIQSLAEGAIKIIQELENFQNSARRRAMSTFNVEEMVDNYLDVLLG